MSLAENASGPAAAIPQWPEGGVTRVPYWVFQRNDVYAREQQRVFQGPAWFYLCLEADLPEPGSFRTTYVGDAPVVVVRDNEGEICCFENRCAHRGALLCLDEDGKAKQGFTCVYHGWSYDLKGNLNGVAFLKGLKGQGGMPSTFKMSDHSPRKLRVATLHGLVFGTFSEETPSLTDWLGETIIARIARVLEGKKPVVLARYTQTLPNNWKLYMENVKDSYHASILHLFFTTFELNRLNYKGGLIVEGGGGHHVSFNQLDRAQLDKAYSDQNLRSDSNYKLKDPSMLQGFNEFPDGITLQILTTFPTFVLQQIQNAVATRQVVPRGPDRADLHWTILGFEDDTPEQRLVRVKQANLVGAAGFISMEDGCVGGFVQRGIAGAPDIPSVIEMGGASTQTSESRVSEAAIRGFWQEYRTLMGM